MEPPSRFTCPFRYVPHPLAVAAARQVRDYLATQPQWRDELSRGKMMGVLVTRDTAGRLAFLAAFSGTLAGANVHPYFVPPVYDILSSESEFRRGEQVITAINRRIDALSSSPQLLDLKERMERHRASQGAREREWEERMAAAKCERDSLRAAGPLDAEREASLVKQSQWFKAEFKRIKRDGMAQAELIAARVARLECEIDALKQERKRKSEWLQRRLFELFVVVNARGERDDLLRIFERAHHRLPPAGAGECCAPRLLQYAFLNGLKPLCMAEFWVGDGGAGHEVRRDGNFYPACDSKCRPILNFMLQGLDVDAPYGLDDASSALRIIARDEWLLVVDKPAGLLSVPGRLTNASVTQLLAARGIEALPVHRLDMDTSGLLVLATTPQVQRLLQRQFETRRVTKVYEALVRGIIPDDEGRIDLPLAPDFDNRPLQRVDREHGLPSLTHYRVLERRDNLTRLELRPLTGRTHQLRLHCATALDAPIVGDLLYGNRPTPEPSTAPIPETPTGAAIPSRLCLHARELSLIHPITRLPLHFTSPVPF